MVLVVLVGRFFFQFSPYLFNEHAARTECVMWDSPKPSTGVKSLALSHNIPPFLLQESDKCV